MNESPSKPELPGLRRKFVNSALKVAIMGFAVALLAACGGGEPSATRTPVPTWTATPSVGDANVENPPAQTETPVSEQATTVPEDTPTFVPTETPPPAPTDTVSPAEEPTATQAAEPTPTVSFAFDLQTAEKFPTESLAPNMVRVYLYVSDTDQFGLAGYKLSVMHEDKQLTVDTLSEAGLPKLTRDTPGPFSRFTNMNAVFVESQSGRWTIQLLDPNSSPVGPPATFDLTADEVTRELYVRYQLK